MGILEGSDGFEAFIHTENYKPRQMKMTLKLKMSDVYCRGKLLQSDFYITSTSQKSF